MKYFLFLIFAFSAFTATDFAQKTPIKKPVAPVAKKETATDKKAKPSSKKETALPTVKKTDAPAVKKNAASNKSNKNEIAPSARKEVKKESATAAKKTSAAKKESVTTVNKTSSPTQKDAKKEVVTATKNSAPPAEKVAPPVTKTVTITKVLTADWKILIDALQSEKWAKADAIAADYLKKLTAENNEKQLAQLRYFRLYTLAGEINAFHEAKLADEENAAWTTLDRIVSEFDGKEIILPPHQFLADCRESVNFVCPVKTDDHALRVTATNKEGTAIHAFNYVSFNDKIVFDNFDGGKIFLGGKLRRAEFNQDLSKPWIMRLFFDDGFIARADVN